MTKQHLDYLVTAYIRAAITEQAFGEINALLTPGKLLADALEEAWGHCSDLCLELPYDIWKGSPFRERICDPDRKAPWGRSALEETMQVEYDLFGDDWIGDQ